MFCNICYVKVNVVDEIPMVVQHTLSLSYSGYVKSKLYSTCRHCHGINCQVTPQNKVNIGAYIILYTDYCGYLSTLYVNQYIPWYILVRFKSQGPSLWSRKVRFCRVAIDLNVPPSLIHCMWNRYDETGQFTRRVGQVMDIWQSHRMTDIWLFVRCGIVQQLPENCNKTSGELLESQCLTRQ
jgi:hypothetical protein